MVGRATVKIVHTHIQRNNEHISQYKKQGAQTEFVHVSRFSWHFRVHFRM